MDIDTVGPENETILVRLFENMILDPPTEPVEDHPMGESYASKYRLYASKYREKYLKYKIKYHLLTQKISENKEK